ncbi:MAG: ABC transporter permease [Gammaproteobacteria bacterium]
MTLAMFRAMFLGLVNDRGALLMAFLMPIIFFLVLAEIFSGAAGQEMQLRVAIANEQTDEYSERLLAALEASGALEIVTQAGASRQQVETLVRKGTADIGLVVRADGAALTEIGGYGAPPIMLISDPARGVAVPMLTGQIQEAYFSALPDVALGGVAEVIADQLVEFSDEQLAELDDGLAGMREDAMAGRGAGWSLGDMIERNDIAGQSAARNHVAYYAGAVAFLFLLFSSMQGAVSLAEEQESGVIDRIMAGPGGISVLVNGKYLYLIMQGFVQMLLIFTVAWQVYDVDLPGHFGPWLVVTLLACMTAAGISLMLAAMCRTRMQAHNFTTVFILVMSVVGGSMVPRFFMPEWLRDLGWFTPNTWVIESYAAFFWRGEGLENVLLPCTLLGVVGIGTLLAAQWFAAQRARI